MIPAPRSCLGRGHAQRSARGQRPAPESTSSPLIATASCLAVPGSISTNTGFPPKRSASALAADTSSGRIRNRTAELSGGNAARRADRQSCVGARRHSSPGRLVWWHRRLRGRLSTGGSSPIFVATHDTSRYPRQQAMLTGMPVQTHGPFCPTLVIERYKKQHCRCLKLRHGTSLGGLWITDSDGQTARLCHEVFSPPLAAGDHSHSAGASSGGRSPDLDRSPSSTRPRGFRVLVRSRAPDLKASFIGRKGRVGRPPATFSAPHRRTHPSG